MTASRNKASRAVTAALVGVLSVGAVPMVAVAAEASSGANLLVAGESDWVSQATVSAAVDELGHEVYLGSEIRFAYTGNSYKTDAHYVKPTEIYNESVEDNGGYLDVVDSGYYVKYYKVVDSTTEGAYQLSDGTWVEYYEVDPYNITDVGSYVAVVTYDENTSAKGSSCFVKFQIVSTKYDDAYVCDYTNGDVNDTVIEYNGKNQTFGNEDLAIVVGGKVLDLDGYDQKVYKVGVGSDDDSTYANEAGDYVVRITDPDDGTVVDIPFTIVPLDVSASTIEFDVDVYAKVGGEGKLPTKVTYVGDAEVTDWDNKTDTGRIGTATISLTYKDGTAPTSGVAGSYTYVVTATDDDGNVINSQEVTVVRYANDAIFSYNRSPITDEDLEKGYYDLGASAFDPSAVQASDNSGSRLGVSIAYTTADGTLLGEDQPTAPGTYYAVVTALDDTYAYGGQVKVKFVVSPTLVGVSDIYASYKGVTLKDDSVTDIYDGSDLMQNLSVSATDEDGNAVPEGELEIVVTDESGDVVDGVVEAGTYTVKITTVEGSSYFIGDEGYDFITFTVDPVTYDGTEDVNCELRLVGTMGYGEGGDKTYLYTGEAVTPTYEYDLTAEMWGYDSSYDWVALPESAYDVQYQMYLKGTWVDVDECVEPGEYRALLSDKAVDSYEISTFVHNNQDTAIYFGISDTKVYADVANDQWYSSYVYDATDKGYMSGYADGTFFGPADSISRADVVMVLWRMAGEPVGSPSEGSTSDLVTYDLPYTDVDEGAYYAQALQWATKVGIVAGDGDAQETFRPSASVTREELAKMLYVYEDLQGNVGDVDVDATLAAYEDEGTVSAWARTYVAYLVDEGVMGVNSGLKGGDAITRAEVAAMVVRVQPDGPLDGFMTSNN